MIHLEINKLEGLSLDLPSGVSFGGLAAVNILSDESIGEKR